MTTRTTVEIDHNGLHLIDTRSKVFTDLLSRALANADRTAAEYLKHRFGVTIKRQRPNKVMCKPCGGGGGFMRKGHRIETCQACGGSGVTIKPHHSEEEGAGR